MHYNPHPKHAKLPTVDLYLGDLIASTAALADALGVESDAALMVDDALVAHRNGAERVAA